MLRVRKRIGVVGAIATGLLLLEGKLRWEWGWRCLKCTWIVKWEPDLRKSWGGTWLSLGKVVATLYEDDWEF